MTASITGHVPWMTQAACRGLDPDSWYPPDSTRRVDPVVARVCAACPVRQQCADYADTHGITYGVWGGKNRNPAALKRAATAEATHCAHGHDWATQARYYPSGARYCATCRRAANRRAYARKNARQEPTA